MADRGDAVDHSDEGCVELGIVEEVGMRIREVGEDTTHRGGLWPGRGPQRQCRS
jgi:hypothetical protein